MKKEEEFEKIYEELRNESEKDNKKELNAKELDDCKVKNEILYQGFLEDNDIIKDLLNFITIYTRIDVINSIVYQKNKALKIFKDFLSFKKIKYRFNEDYSGLTKQLYEDFDSYTLIHPENYNIINDLNNQQLNSNTIKKENKLKLIPIQSSKKMNKSFSKGNFWSSEKNHRNILQNSISRINLKDYNYSKNENNNFLGKIKNKSASKLNAINQDTNINKSIEKKKDFIVEKIEKSSGWIYEADAIDFIKYTLFFSVLEKKVDFPEIVNIQFKEELLQKVKKENELEKEKDISMKTQVKFDLVIKNLSKKELQIFINKLGNNVFLKEKLNLDKEKDNKNFDLLVEVAKDYFSQSQDKYSQISTYITLIKILNYLKDPKNAISDELKNMNKDYCEKLKVDEENEKVFILMTNGSYNLLSQVIKLSKSINFDEISNEKVIGDKDYSFKYNNNIDKILSKLIKDKPISKIFSVSKNNRNVPNLNKFLNILYDLNNSNIRYSIIYFEDDIGTFIDNNIINDLTFHFKNNNKEINCSDNYNLLKQKIEEMENIKQLNLSFKIKIDEFLNLLPTTEIKIKKAIEEYFEKIKNNERIREIALNIIKQIKKQSLFKNNKAIFYLKSNQKSTYKICNNLEDIFDCKLILSDLDIKDYNDYLVQIKIQLDSWLIEISNNLIKIDFKKDIYYKNTDYFETNNIMDVIIYNLNKYYNKKCVINKNINLDELNYQSNIPEDAEIYDKLSFLLKDIFIKFKELFNKDIINEKRIINSLISNCKCYYFYSFIFYQIQTSVFLSNRNYISNKILETF